MKYKGKYQKWKVNRQETTRTWAHRQLRKRRRGRKSENTNYRTETEVERIWTAGESGGPPSPAGGPCSPDTSQVEATHLDFRESGEMPAPSHAPPPTNKSQPRPQEAEPESSRQHHFTVKTWARGQRVKPAHRACFCCSHPTHTAHPGGRGSHKGKERGWGLGMRLQLPTGQVFFMY